MVGAVVVVVVRDGAHSTICAVAMCVLTAAWCRTPKAVHRRVLELLEQISK